MLNNVQGGNVFSSILANLGIIAYLCTSKRKKGYEINRF